MALDSLARDLPCLGVGGIVCQPGFYESVVVREFAGRFTETIHKPQPLYFYLPHLFHKFAPWSVLLIGFAIFFWRRRERSMRPETLWLVCWSVGGLLLMSVIPSKRVDRIFPVIPPLCLLLGAQVAAAVRVEPWTGKVRPWLAAALIFAGIFTGGYVAWKIGQGYHARSDALVRFSRHVRREAQQHDWRFAVVGGREEGMLLYLRRDHFLTPDDAVEQWKSGRLDALVVRDQSARSLADAPPRRASSSSSPRNRRTCRITRSSCALGRAFSCSPCPASWD